MRGEFDRLLQDATLVTIALAIALGWSLFQVAEGVGDLVTTLFTDYSDTPGFTGAPLTWTIGDRLLTVYTLVRGAVELMIVLAVTLFVNRQRRFAKPS